eukprot:8862412-Ditylum_brightwellii.AAC.1
MDTTGLLLGPLVAPLSSQTTRSPYDNPTRLQNAYAALPHPQTEGTKPVSTALEKHWLTT